MTTYQINWSRLSFLRTVNTVLSVISFAICIALWVMFGWQWGVGSFLFLSLVIALGYRVAFGLSTIRAYYLWIRRGQGHMAEYVAERMGIIREVEVPDNFPSGVARSFLN